MGFYNSDLDSSLSQLLSVAPPLPEHGHLLLIVLPWSSAAFSKLLLPAADGLAMPTALLFMAPPASTDMPSAVRQLPGSYLEGSEALFFSCQGSIWHLRSDK